VTGIKRDQSLLKTQTLLEGSHIIGCDVLNIGTKDLAEGRDFIKEMENKASFPFISANIIDKETEKLLFKPYEVISKDNLRFGIVGLTARIPNHIEDLAVLNFVEEGKKVLAKIEEKSDYQIVLFNGTYKEAEVVKDSLQSADFIFLSGDTRFPSRRRKENPTGLQIYRLGREGRSLGVVHLEIENINLGLVDISFLKSRESFITRQIDRMRKKDPSREIEEIYKDNPRVLERVRQIKGELNSVKQQLAKVTNTIKFDFVAMTKKVEDDPKLLVMVNETLAECKRIAKASKVPLTSLKTKSSQ